MICERPHGCHIVSCNRYLLINLLIRNKRNTKNLELNNFPLVLCHVFYAVLSIEETIESFSPDVSYMFLYVGFLF